MLGTLSRSEAASRLKAEGYNELPARERRKISVLFFDLLREPMIGLLLFCGAIYLLLGDSREACLILGSIGIVIGISFYQEAKTERALEALRDLSSPRAMVIRDGEPFRISGREVVRGDFLLLSEGDRVAADGVVRSQSHLLVDESLLTGESGAVRKSAIERPVTMAAPGEGEQPFVYAGTLVVAGQALAEVLGTGLKTQMGRIGKALQQIKPEQTKVQQETTKIVRILAVIGIALCLIVVVLYGLTRQDWLQGFLAGLTLAISMVPEELPVVLTVFLALGAWRISRHHVLTRRIPAVEMLGETTVLCSDKTGTLTMNQMSVQQLAGKRSLWNLDDPQPPAEEILAVAEHGILATRRDPFDPTDKAVIQLQQRVPGLSSYPNLKLEREYALSSRRLVMAQAWRFPEKNQVRIVAKGAPEAIAALCRMNPAAAEGMQRNVESMAGRALRVLGVAKCELNRGAELPEALEELAFKFIGLIGLADPIRPAAVEALNECRSAGIRVVMITGDYAATARQVAASVGLSPADLIVTGKELDGMSDEALRHRIRTVNIFSRIVPEQKLRLVNALKANGEIVAMTGDGVNDAPALKAAHIGIAMGARGTDVAREAASLVLLNDDFSSIVKAIALGRRIFDNLQKAMAYLIAVHVPIAGMTLLPIALRWPLVLLPVHIVFLELIIDPACSIAFEAEAAESNVMTRPPRPPQNSLFNRKIVVLSLLQGLSVLAIVFAIFAASLASGFSGSQARTLAFSSMIAANLALIFTNRSWSRSMIANLRSPNPALWGITAGALAVLALVLYVPGLRELFHFSLLRPGQLALSLAIGLIGILWFEAFKMIENSRLKNKKDTPL
ncbi:MAG: cation-translocating P-type ATPase [Candidatus Omnitrophica bacterium]|nr:cation-translocating P-type ATPase [Candidatus Omnitrophota bacterium]